MRITPSPLNISQLFSSNNEQFFVPAYQRRYAWSEKQLGELFDDINLLKDNETHLLGTVLFLADSHTAGINKLELVDGQQRITSLSILLKAIQDKFKKTNHGETAKEINNYLFCKGVDRKEQNKILLGDLDSPDYLKLLKLTDLDEIKNLNLLAAYRFFEEWIKEYVKDLNTFYFKLINNLLVIRLDVGQAKDAYKLFETINNRGLRLSPTDIIKNFILGHASTVDDNVLINVRNSWKDLIVHLDGIGTDDYFRQFLAGILRRKITFSKLVDVFKEYYLKNVKEAENLSEYHLYKDNTSEIQEDNQDNRNDSENGNDIITNKKMPIVKFVKLLKNSSAIYAKIINRTFENKKINERLYNLDRIKSFPSYIFLLSLFQREEIKDKELVRILKTIETFMLRRHICEYRTNELDDIFSKLVDIQNIVDVIAILKKHLPADGEFEEKFSKYSFQGNIDRAKYVLEEIEYFIIKNQGEYALNSGNEVHLEHIIPQTIDTKKAKQEYGDWVSYLGNNALEKHDDYINLIGNLTLLAEALNIKASNNPFLAKKKEYRKSNIKMTKHIAEDYSSFKFAQVEKRSINLAKYAVNIWTF